MTDEERWVADAVAGDDLAFTRLLRPHRQGMMNLAYRMTGSREAAEEICQEALIKVFKYLSRFQTGRSFRNWAFKITANAALDFLRRRRREASVIRDRLCSGEMTAPSPEREIVEREMGLRLQACLQDLTPKERMVFILRDIDGFSVKESAEVMKISAMAVRTHLSRARSKLRGNYQRIRPVGPAEDNP
jgi:RNA polymerase sigma-70 factor (ECF subfamily)